MSQIGKSAREAVGTFFPGYFAMVMATGVIAIQTNKLGFPIVARALLGIAVAAYLIIWLITLTRASQFGPQLVADFRSLVKGPAFFTTSAGTTVLGKSLLLVLALPLAAEGLWAFAWLIWAFLMYAFAVNLFTSHPKLPLEKSVNGAWLIIPVATQSLSILTSLLAPTLPNHGLMMLVSLSMFMLGDALYLGVLVAVVYRLAFFELEPEDLKPPYWVCMGASAISTLAGVELCKKVSMWHMPFQPLPSLQGFTMFFWVISTAWIPLLLVLGIWRHGVHKVPLKYDPQYWSMVFPLAMYSICTGGVADIFGLDALRSVSKTFLILAMLAWSIVFMGLLKNLVSAAVAASRTEATTKLAVAKGRS